MTADKNPIEEAVDQALDAFVYAPIGLLLRAFGKDPLELRILPDATTYWEDATPERPRESYFKQF